MNPGVASFPGFRPHADVDLVILVAGVGYWWATSRVAPATRRQRRWFWTGLVLLWIGASWPIHDVGEDYLYSVHMVQHLLFTYIAPPLLLLGVPADLTRWLVRNPVVGFFGRWVARPVPALVFFNVMVAVSHVKQVVDHATTSAPLHFLVHLLLFSASLCFWQPVISQVPELPRLRSAAKMLYLMLNTFLVVPIVSALALAGKPIYEHYALVPRLWGSTALNDQQTSAGIMWVVESFWMVGAIALVFFDWYRNEQRDPAKASLPEHIRHRPVAPATHP